MWGYIDDQDRLLAINPNDMSGNSGWERMKTKLTQNDQLEDENGVALYKVVGGSIVARSQKELAADLPKEDITISAKSEYGKAKTTTAKLDALAKAVWGGI